MATGGSQAEQDSSDWEDGMEEPVVEGGHLNIQEVQGFTVTPCIQPCHPFCVVSALGSLVVVWDWKLESRRILRRHRNFCQAICFRPDGKILMSADSEAIYWWDCSEWECFGSTPLASDDASFARMRPACILFLQNISSMVILGQDINVPSMQTVCVWQFDQASDKAPTPSQRITRKLDQGVVHSIQNGHEKGDILCCSDEELSAFSFSLELLGATRNSLDTKWTIYSNVSEGQFVDITSSAAFNWTFALTTKGNISVIDNLGTRLRTVKLDKWKFSCCCLSEQDTLLVGTTEGTIICFQIPSLNAFREIHYDPKIRGSQLGSRLATGHQGFRKTAAPGWDEVRSGVMVERMGSIKNLCLRCTSDHSVSIVDLSTGSVCNGFFAHMDHVLGFAAASVGTNQRPCIFTASADETVGVWEYDDSSSSSASFRPRFIDVASSVHPALSYYRTLSNATTSLPTLRNQNGVDTSVHDIRDPPEGEIHFARRGAGISGDVGGSSNSVSAAVPARTSVGTRKSMDVPNKRNQIVLHAVAVETTRRLLACGTSQGCCLVFDTTTHALLHSIDLSRAPTASLCFARGGFFLVARNTHGVVWVLDGQSGFARSILVQSFSDIRSSPSYVWPSHDVLITSSSSDTQPTIATFFSVLTLSEPRLLALYSIDTDNASPISNQATLPPIATFPLEFPPCSILLHASGSHVFTLAESGLMQVHHLHSSDSDRGGLWVLPREERENEHRSTCMACDSSGLYVATVSVSSRQETSTLRVWEAATGVLIDVMRDLPPSSRCSFLSDSSAIVLACPAGALLLLSLSHQLRYDSRYVRLGGPPAAGGAVGGVGAGGKVGGELDQGFEGGVAKFRLSESGYERHARVTMGLDPCLRAVPGTRAGSVEGVWADRRIQLPVSIDELRETRGAGGGAM